MSIFDTIKEKKQNKAAAREENLRKEEQAKETLRAKLANSPLLISLIDTILTRAENGDEWIRYSQGTDDRKTREVILDGDTFEIRWVKYTEEIVGYNSWGIAQYEKKENVLHSLAYSYTKSGYKSLGLYTDPATGVTLSSYTVRTIWADVLHDRMKELMPGCDFRDAFYSGFRYDVASPTAEIWD